MSAYICSPFGSMCSWEEFHKFDLRNIQLDWLPFSWHHGLILAGSYLLSHALRFHWHPEETKHCELRWWWPRICQSQSSCTFTTSLPVGQASVKFHNWCLTVMGSTSVSDLPTTSNGFIDSFKLYLQLGIYWKCSNTRSCNNMVIYTKINCH